MIVATAADAAADVAGEVYPLMDAVVWGEATVVVLGTDAQFDERIVDQARGAARVGVRVRTRSLFYEEWLGKIPVHRPRPGCAVLRHRRAAPRPLWPDEADLRRRVRCDRCDRDGRGDPVRLRRESDREPRSDLLRAGAGWSIGNDFLDPEVPHDARGLRPADRLDVVG